MKLARILLAAPKSGSGKTTVTCGILSALQKRGLHPAAFKCGPDYIDTMFHRKVLGIESCNLDLFLCGKDAVYTLFQNHAEGFDLSVIEGVMGYYDGLGGRTEIAGSYDLARTLETPVILVLDPSGMSYSVVALVRGMQNFRKDSNIKGIILNRCGEKMYLMIKEILEEETGLAVLGYFPTRKDCAFESRHLGLISVDEVRDIKEKINLLGEQAEKTLDMDRLIKIAGLAPDLSTHTMEIPLEATNHPVISVAMDEAFSFYYADNLKLLEQMGAELRYFSPLHDTVPPKNTDGFYFGGGYPELFLEKLGANRKMCQEIKAMAEKNLPVYAECGGFMYLQEFCEGPAGNIVQLCGVLPGKCFPTGRLVRFGYGEMEAEKDTVFLTKGEKIPFHEFHHWDSTHNGDCMVCRKPFGGAEWFCGVGKNQVYAGYPHLHFYGNLQFAANFVKAAACYKERKDVT